MTGRAIIFLVVGVIIISAIILYNIEAASTGIVANFDNAYLSQSAQNLAESGVSMGLRQVANNATWRTGFSMMNFLGGKVSVRAFDTTFSGRQVIAVSATGITAYNTAQESRASSIAFVPAPLKPVSVKAAITTNAQTKNGGGLLIDGENHTTSGILIAGTGIFGLWTTNTLTSVGSSKIGGTSTGGVDHPPASSPDTSVIRTGQTYPGGFPTSPDSVMGGTSSGYSEGTLKLIALNGTWGSQYVTDPSTLKYPLAGVTYVELVAGGTWSPTLSGTGVLVVHNSTRDGQFKSPAGAFTGLLVVDDITSLSGVNILGAVVQMTPNPKSVQIGTSNGSVIYSKQAILNATSNLNSSGNGSAANVIGWWE